MTRLNAARAFPVALVVLVVLVVLIRSPSDASGPRSAAEAPSGTDEASGGVVAQTRAETGEPPAEQFVRTGCFRSGSSRNEVRTVMGPPDTVDRGAWVYGESWVTFGYGVVLDFSNTGGDLRLCE